MAVLKDEYAQRAFNNISEAAEEEKLDTVGVIAKYFGSELRCGGNIDERLEYLDKICDIKSRTIRLEGKWYSNSAMPLLVKTENGEFAVIPDTFGVCRYYENGRYKKITKKNSAMFGSEAKCFYKGFSVGKITAVKLVKYIFDSISLKDKIMVAVMSILATLTGLIFPAANYIIFNHIIPSGTFGDILPMAALLIGVTGTIAAAELMRGTVLTNVISKIEVNVQGAMFSRVLRLKSGFFRKENPGELADIIINFTDIGGLISVQSLSALLGVVLSVFYLIQMNIYAPEIIGAAVSAAFIVLCLSVNEAVQFIKWRREYSGAMSAMTGMVYEIFSVMEKIKLNGAATRMFERWSEKYRDVILKEERPFMLMYSSVLFRIVTFAALIFVFILGAKAKVAMADYIAFNSAYGSFIGTIGSVGIILETAAEFMGAYKLVKPVFDAETEECENKKTTAQISGNIEFSNVRFRYAPDLPYVLDGISLKIEKGESVGIVGKSGCGKSTLLRLLLGFEETSEGGILVDGTDLREIDLQSYRSRLGIVLQDSKLMNDDIYSNITITAPYADNDDVDEAVESAGLTADIENMPMGLRTIVSEENSTISGGQKQRILIARAIINKPPILIFDEATSALDNLTQEQVTKSVDALKSTRIIIAHRLSTIRNCNRIIFLDKGKIAEEGTYDELMEKKGLFYDMASRQLA